MDIESISPGVDFVEAIDSVLLSCDVILILIGPRWVSTSDSNGVPRLNDPSDFVRLEVEKALESSALVIPVLVGGATMPDSHSLPPSIAPLLRKHAIEVSDRRFWVDIRSLSSVIMGHLTANGRVSASESKLFERRLRRFSGDATRLDSGKRRAKPSSLKRSTLWLSAVVIAALAAVAAGHALSQHSDKLQIADSMETADTNANWTWVLSNETSTNSPANIHVGRTYPVTCRFNSGGVTAQSEWWYLLPPTTAGTEPPVIPSIDFYNNGMTKGLTSRVQVDAKVKLCRTAQLAASGYYHTERTSTQTYAYPKPSTRYTASSRLPQAFPVEVVCRVTDHHFRNVQTWYRIVSGISGDLYASSSDFVSNVKRNFNFDPQVPPCASSGGKVTTTTVRHTTTTVHHTTTTVRHTTTTVPLTGRFLETVGGNANTWSDYLDAGGTNGPGIPQYDSVAVSCRITGFTVSDGNNWWYLIVSSPWSSNYYVSADAFYNNGATSG